MPGFIFRTLYATTVMVAMPIGAVPSTHTTIDVGPSSVFPNGIRKAPIPKELSQQGMAGAAVRRVGVQVIANGKPTVAGVPNGVRKAPTQEDKSPQGVGGSAVRRVGAQMTVAEKIATLAEHECMHRPVIARRYLTCGRSVYDCQIHRSCDRGGFDRGSCGDILLPAEDSFTAFYKCNDDCSRGPRLECAVRREDAMLGDARVTSAQWDEYVLRLYSAERSQLNLLPRIDKVSMVYMHMLPLRNVQRFDSRSTCPISANHAPALLGLSHVGAAAHYNLAAPPEPVRNNAWVEVTHCSSHQEKDSLWFYVSPGSGIFVNIGNTIVFDDHPAAFAHFGMYGGDERHLPTLRSLPHAAAAAGYDTIHFLEHCEGCRCDHEMIFLHGRGTGTAACPQGVEFRTGANASLPCTCQMKPIGGDKEHMNCITCSSFNPHLM